MKPIVPLHALGEAARTTVEAFSNIFIIFLVLGVLVGIVVIGYTFYNILKNRESNSKNKIDEPVLGKLPSKSDGGRKLFYSFGISAIIVVTLVAWAYGTLIYFEQGPSSEQIQESQYGDFTVNVTGFQWGWRFEYPNGYSTTGELRIPKNELVDLRVTSSDVFHNFGIPEWRVKTDAIPGEISEAWFTPTQTGTYTARCYEMCGAGHSYMTADIIVMERNKFQNWYSNVSTN